MNDVKFKLADYATDHRTFNFTYITINNFDAATLATAMFMRYCSQGLSSERLLHPPELLVFLALIDIT